MESNIQVRLVHYKHVYFSRFERYVWFDICVIWFAVNCAIDILLYELLWVYRIDAKYCVYTVDDYHYHSKLLHPRYIHAVQNDPEPAPGSITFIYNMPNLRTLFSTPAITPHPHKKNPKAIMLRVHF